MGRQIAGHNIIRVAYIVEQLINGVSPGGIKSDVIERYKISPRQTDKLIAAAKRSISERADEGKEYHLTVAKERLNTWASESAKKGDYRTACIVQRELDDITGLHQSGNQTTINVTNYYPSADTVQTLIIAPDTVTGPNET